MSSREALKPPALKLQEQPAGLPPMTGKRTKGRLFKKWWLWSLVLLVPVVGYFVFLRGADAPQQGPTFAVHRGPLKITVTEGGSVDALESQEIKSYVQGQTKILSIVEEGSTVTQKDVDSGKILVELDSTDLVEKQTAQELDYQNARAAFTQAKEDFEIQENQNQSDITEAELAVKFAQSDLEKYLSSKVLEEVMKQVVIKDDEPEQIPDLDSAEKTTSDKNKPDADKKEESGEKEKAPSDTHDPNIPPIDFSKYADGATLGDGAAGQQLRTLEDAYVLAKEQLGLSQTQFEGTERLAKREFVTKNDLENERLNVEKNEIALKSAETSKKLFIQYEFPKMAEKMLSDYVEASRKLTRAKKLALSKLAQAEARLKACEASFTLQTQKRKNIQEQIDKCKIKAARPGLVVYAGGEDWRGDDRIEEGALVRERQKIITIPDMNQMAVKIKVHESAIKNVKKGQKARVIVDAYPDDVLTGEVVKVGVLPDSQNRWMNPDVKVYECSISIDGTQAWLKPGMSAQVDIDVRELKDVLFVPLEAVSSNNGEHVCYVTTAGDPERRVVEPGEFNNEYIEIKSGLKEGETILLHAPTQDEQNAQNGTADSATADNPALNKKDDKAVPKEQPKDKPPEKKPDKPA